MESIHVENSLVIPLRIGKGKIFGLLEISNVTRDLSAFDEEYFAIVCSNFLVNILQKNCFIAVYKDDLK